MVQTKWIPPYMQTGRDYSKSLNPNAGKQFIDAIDATGKIVDANNQIGSRAKV
jgi:hypothetical protein